jgi:hypothetical protein
MTVLHMSQICHLLVQNAAGHKVQCILDALVVVDCVAGICPSLLLNDRHMTMLVIKMLPRWIPLAPLLQQLLLLLLLLLLLQQLLVLLLLLLAP